MWADSLSELKHKASPQVSPQFACTMSCLLPTVSGTTATTGFGVTLACRPGNPRRTNGEARRSREAEVASIVRHTNVAMTLTTSSTASLLKLNCIQQRDAEVSSSTRGPSRAGECNSRDSGLRQPRRRWAWPCLSSYHSTGAIQTARSTYY